MYSAESDETCSRLSPFRELHEPQEWRGIAEADLRSQDIANSLFRVADEFHARKAKRDGGIRAVRFLTVGMQARKHFVYGERRGEHVDTDDGGPVPGHAPDISILHLPVVSSRVIPAQTGSGDVAHREQSPADKAGPTRAQIVYGAANFTDVRHAIEILGRIQAYADVKIGN
jgi:hypothetical protein